MSEKLESFFVGGRYIQTDRGQELVDHVYVQRRAPESVTRPYPIVFIPGGHQTAMNFETTPDGRPGWAHYFVDRGYVVYLLDQPGLGRSGYVPAGYGELEPPHPAEWVERHFTAPAVSGLWPQARLHTQWPGSGRRGDPVFDQFVASQAHAMGDNEYRERAMREAGAALLDRIGPAVLLTHSQSGAFGWAIGDARPDAVRAIVAVEPPRPFVDALRRGAPDYFVDGPDIARPYGLTLTAIAYEPPVQDARADLAIVQESQPAGEHAVRCHLQVEPARPLANLSRVPVAVLTAEASWHAGYDHCTVGYLRQGGVDVTHLWLAELGIGGNGHMMMLEKNADDIAAVIHRWLAAKLAGAH